MYDDMFAYVKELLEEKDCEYSKTFHFPFRKRSDHIRRVYLWARRLLDCEDLPADFAQEILLTAAIFHDSGYALSEDSRQHARGSVEVFRTYAAEHDMNSAFTDFVSSLIVHHSQKELMTATSTPMELIILMEADLLDETGVLSIVWDAMAEGALPEQSFEKTYRHILRTVNRMKVNPMVTPGARDIWERKKQITCDFTDQLAYDLDITQTSI